ILTSLIFSHLYVLVIAFLTSLFFFFFLNDPATTEIYTLSLHDALPIFRAAGGVITPKQWLVIDDLATKYAGDTIRLTTRQAVQRSEEHTSELQSRENLVCRLLLEKKKKKNKKTVTKQAKNSENYR